MEFEEIATSMQWLSFINWPIEQACSTQAIKNDKPYGKVCTPLQQLYFLWMCEFGSQCGALVSQMKRLFAIWGLTRVKDSVDPSRSNFPQLFITSTIVEVIKTFLTDRQNLHKAQVRTPSTFTVSDLTISFQDPQTMYPSSSIGDVRRRRSGSGGPLNKMNRTRSATGPIGGASSWKPSPEVIKVWKEYTKPEGNGKSARFFWYPTNHSDYATADTATVQRSFINHVTHTLVNDVVSDISIEWYAEYKNRLEVPSIWITLPHIKQRRTGWAVKAVQNHWDPNTDKKFCSVRDRLIDNWNSTQQYHSSKDPKRVYYLSLEFLIGRSLDNALLNLNVKPNYQKALTDVGFRLEEFLHEEVDAALGNGGLGKALERL